MSLIVRRLHLTRPHHHVPAGGIVVEAVGDVDKEVAAIDRGPGARERGRTHGNGVLGAAAEKVDAGDADFQRFVFQEADAPASA